MDWNSWSNEQIIESAETLHDIFWPRRTWASPVAAGSERLLDLMILLLVLKKAGLLDVKHEAIPSCMLERSSWLKRQWHSPTPDVWALQYCAGRRGGDDLKEQSWSAYRSLRRRCKGETITLISDLPFCYLAETSRVAVIAGNVDAERALKAIVDYEITSFGVVGNVDTEVLGEEAWNSDYLWQLTSIEITARGLAMLKGHFQRKHEEMMAAAGLIFKEMQKEFSSKICSISERKK